MEKGGVIVQGNEGVPLKDRQKESARITFHFLSHREPLGKSGEGCLNRRFIEGSCGVSDSGSF